MKRLKAILFIIVALCSFLIIGSLVEAAPSTVSVTVKSYFDEENIITQTATGKAFGTKFAFDSNLNPSGRNFAYWIVNGVVRNDISSMQHAFYATENLELIAVFTPADQFAVVFMDSNGKLLKVEYVSAGGDATDISTGLPSKPGYQISSSAKWSGSLTNIQANTVLVLQYEKSETATYSVVVNNGTGDGTYEYNQVATVVADPAPSEQVFSHWTIDGVIASRSATYQFTVLRNTTVEAVYAAETPVDNPLVFLNKGLDLRDNYISYQGNFYLPTGYELIELGILYAEHEESFDLDTATVSKKTIGKYNLSTNEFLVSLSDTSHNNARAYMMYTNTANTEVYFAYSNYIIPTYKDLFISEYGEGSGSNKWIEIYNPTNQSINLSNYKLQLFSNGSSTASVSLSLADTTLSPQTTYIVYNSGLTATIDNENKVISNTVANFNGDDALALLKNDVIIDVFGVIGTDPGENWPVGSGSTLDHTLVRKYGVYWPNVTWNTEEWDVLPKDNFDYIGYHNTSEVLPTSVTISGATEVVETETIELVATVLPSNVSQAVTWTSLDPSIATVDETGLVTGVSEGTVIIKATSSVDTDLYDEYEITVTAQTFYTVQFNLNGGNSAAIADQTIAEGNTVDKPSNPSHATDNFVGWFTQASEGSEWNFNSDTVAGNMTLYAQWSSVVSSTTVIFTKVGANYSTTPADATTSFADKLTTDTNIQLFAIKGGTSSYLALRTDDMARLYGNKTDGNGNTLIIQMMEGYKITAITLTYTITNDCTFSVLNSLNESIGTVSSGQGISGLDTSKISIKNTHITSGTVGQLKITGITITYIPG